ncbi:MULTISPECIES: alpha/beta fold hydrolase [Actinoalloteichus]|uniref:ABC-2 type transport system ATP-binding protein n=1 Tax=Actinoalloteichus caeruleus DSM 43889 TaxID=1120930 RepID=A0ABT1JGA3_ACTCY|nr:alpha/beta fold hydrolase [Actinoalloteichus caeruleus]MCP2331522.1 ABC-2 type transport system ATP-binding protein [Actinoalloteichus caeruleus DSM 43889]
MSFLARNRWWLIALGAVVLLVAGAIAWPSDDEDTSDIPSREFRLEVPEEPGSDSLISLDATVYLPETTPAPAVLLAHGFGGSKLEVSGDARELADRGFVVLTYSARGFGESEGLIGLNSPDHEVRDASALIDWLAEQPEVLTEDGDPVVGVTGGSYGGALSLMVAGTDDRVDAIAPVITYNDLVKALIPNSGTEDATPITSAGTPAASPFPDPGVFKRFWAGLLFTAGSPSVEAPPVASPELGTDDEDGEGDEGSEGARPTPEEGGTGDADGGTGPTPPGCGRFSPELCAAYVELATTGEPSQETVDLLADLSPARFTENITVPSLVVQGSQDTLFGLDQADANAREIAEAGGRVKVVWFAGGHDGSGTPGEVRDQIGAWFDFHLAGRGPDPGTTFEYGIPRSVAGGGGTRVRTLTAPEYPGLVDTAATEFQRHRITGDPTPVLTPAGGQPAAITGLPGLSGVLGGSPDVAGRLHRDVPGQVARFTSEPLAEAVTITGTPRVRVQVSQAPGAATSGTAVLFAKLYEVSPNGTRTLPGQGVSPVRVTGLPADGTPMEVDIALPGIAYTVDSGQRLEVAISTTDQAYASVTEPVTHVVGIAENTDLALPTTQGEHATSPVPWGALAGAGGVVALGVVLALVSAWRRRHSTDLVPDLEDVPIVISGLSKRYASGFTAVDGISLRVERGQVLGLLGPNGAGKTTTLRMLMGLIRPTAGQVRVFGHLVRPGAPVLSRIGAFVEGSGFLPHLSGMENLRLYWAATGRGRESAHFEEALEIAGLGAAVHRKVSTYSQGMRQRLAIAQAMLGLPDLLVLDEPANGLDPPQIHQMREVLRRYASGGRTVVVSSHLLAEVEQTCTHLVVMHRGRVMATGEVRDIVAGGHGYTFHVDQPERAAEVLAAMDGVSEVEAHDSSVQALLGPVRPGAAVTELVRAGIAVEQAGPTGRLEDAFLQMVGEESAP